MKKMIWRALGPMVKGELLFTAFAVVDVVRGISHPLNWFVQGAIFCPLLFFWANPWGSRFISFVVGQTWTRLTRRRYRVYICRADDREHRPVFPTGLAYGCASTSDAKVAAEALAWGLLHLVDYVQVEIRDEERIMGTFMGNPQKILFRPENNGF